MLVAEPVGDDETFNRGLEQARAALGRGRRPRPVVVPDPPIDPDDPAADLDERPDARDERIAQLEAEVRHLRAALARIHDESGHALD